MAGKAIFQGGKGQKQNHCMPAFLTLHNASLLHQCHIFLVMQAGKVKVEVPELVPSTAEEVLEYGLAERRRCHVWQRGG